MKLFFIIIMVSEICLSVISTITETCPKNMSLFPVDENSTELVCDCSFQSDLYFSEDNSCYEAYRQGPCPPEHYLVLPQGEKLSKCEKNSCLKDDLVPFHGTCATIGEPTSACFLGGYLRVNGDNFELMCVFTRNLNIIKAPPKLCPPGSRRTTLENCKQIL